MTLARATDERGRELLSRRGKKGGEPLLSESEIYRSDTAHYDFNLKVPRDARKLNLEFVLHRTRTAEFLAKP